MTVFRKNCTVTVDCRSRETRTLLPFLAQGQKFVIYFRNNSYGTYGNSGQHLWAYRHSVSSCNIHKHRPDAPSTIIYKKGNKIIQSARREMTVLVVAQGERHKWRTIVPSELSISPILFRVLFVANRLPVCRLGIIADSWQKDTTEKQFKWEPATGLTDCLTRKAT
jgi:hypothetical protein